MSVLLVNDMHISHSNIPEFEANWNEGLDVCVENKIKKMIVGGDLFQSRSAQTLDILMAVRAAVKRATSLGIEVTLANGNHDKINQDSCEGYCHVFSGYPDVVVVEDFDSLQLSDGTILHTVAYFPETGKFLDVYDELVSTIDKTKTNILYIHAGINGALQHPSEKDLPANMFGAFDKVLVGHYHDRCHIEKSNVYYIGSSRQHNFGEDEAKGYTIVHEDCAHEHVDNQVNTRYTTIDIPYRKWSDPKLIEKLKKYQDEGKYKVRLIIECKQEEAQSIDKKMLIESGANKVEIKVTDIKVIETATSSLFHKFDTKQIVDNYTEFCNEKGISDASLGVEYLLKKQG